MRVTEAKLRAENRRLRDNYLEVLLDQNLLTLSPQEAAVLFAHARHKTYWPYLKELDQKGIRPRWRGAPRTYFACYGIEKHMREVYREKYKITLKYTLLHKLI